MTSIGVVVNKNLTASFLVEDNKLKMDCVAKSILGLEENLGINTIKDFEKRINGVLDMIGFSTKKVDYDEFVKKYYDDETVYEYNILGAGNYYLYPRGVVYLHPSNKIFYDAANILFMLNEKFIPMCLIDSKLDFSKPIKIPRSSGELSDGSIARNSSIRKSKTTGGMFSYVKFFDNKTCCEMEKNVKIYDLFNANDVETFSLTIPQLNKTDYDLEEGYEFLSNELIDQIIESFNQKIIDFMEKFIENFTDYDVVKDLDNLKIIFTKK